MNNIDTIRNWLDTTALGKAIKSAFYATAAAAAYVLVSSVDRSVANDPNLFGMLTPYVVPVIIFVKNALKPNVPNF